jgi:hypothetical protein
MSWEEVPQHRSNSLNAPVSASLKPVQGGHTRLRVTIDATVQATLMWADGRPLVLQVGRDGNQGRARIVPRVGGRPLRVMPRSSFRMVTLVPPDDLLRWEALQMEVETWQVVPSGPGAAAALEIVLPWDLSGDPAASEAEAEAA